MSRPMPRYAFSAPPAVGDPTDLPTEPIPVPAATVVPRRATGLSLLGEYQGGGYDEPRYLVARADGQMALVSKMLNAVLAAMTEGSTLEQIAARASADYGKVLTPEAVHYLIERKLQPLGLASVGDGDEPPPRANPLLALHLHRVLLPAKVVRRLATFFRPLFLPPVVVVALLAVLSLDAWLLASGNVNTSIHASVGSPELLLAVFAVLLANTFFHEFGHAAGCHYGGGKPGAIGVGVLILVPAFYTNVNDAYRLDRRGRLRTDLGGIYFNSVFCLLLGTLFLLTGFAPLPAIIALIHLQMLQQMIPLVRLDGYYILGDIVGVPNLFEQIPHVLKSVFRRRRPAKAMANIRPLARRIIIAWVALVVPALLYVLVNLVRYVPSYLATATKNMGRYWDNCVQGFSQGNIAAITYSLICIVILLVPWVGVTTFIARTGGKVVTVVAKRRNRARSGGYQEAA